MPAARKDHAENTPSGQKVKADAVKADKGVADQVADAMATETDQGFRGVEVDPTPNEAYTLKGVTSGDPTPETDAEHAEKIRPALKAVEQKAAGVGGR